MTTYYTSDLHDGHNNIPKYRNVDSIVCIESNRQYIREHWRAGEKDIVYILGDVFFAHDSHIFIDSLPGNKIIILGNHDCERSNGSTLSQIISVSKSVHGIKHKHVFINGRKRRVLFQHTPIHPYSIRDCLCMHGHIHQDDLDYMDILKPSYNEKYINVNMDVLIPRTGKIMLSSNELTEYVNGDWESIRNNNHK